MSSSNKINVTKDYRLFKRAETNRPLDSAKRKRLEESMRLYGFLRCFPIVCYRDADKHLIIKDGQHRFAIAEKLGLPIYWVEESVDFDVAKVNGTQEKWKPADYAGCYAQQGNEHYQEILDFHKQYGLAIGSTAALLRGVSQFSIVAKSFYDGSYEVRKADRKLADMIATAYSSIVRLSRSVNNARFLEACIGAARVPGFEAERLIHGAERCREKLVAYATRDAYLDMIEAIYNFGRKILVPIKLPATEIMRKRNAVNLAKAKAVAKKENSNV